MHLCHSMLLHFQKGVKAVQKAKQICAIDGDCAVAENTGCKWFARFRRENFDMKKLTSRKGLPWLITSNSKNCKNIIPVA